MFAIHCLHLPVCFCAKTSRLNVCHRGRNLLSTGPGLASSVGCLAPRWRRSAAGSAGLAQYHSGVRSDQLAGRLIWSWLILSSSSSLSSRSSHYKQSCQVRSVFTPNIVDPFFICSLLSSQYIYSELCWVLFNLIWSWSLIQTAVSSYISYPVCVLISPAGSEKLISKLCSRRPGLSVEMLQQYSRSD